MRTNRRLKMNLRERLRVWTQLIYFLGQNPITLTGAVITTSTALATIAFWFYDFFCLDLRIHTLVSWSFWSSRPFL
jgi:hypothetical protein